MVADKVEEYLKKRESNREFLLGLAPLIENLSEEEADRLKQEFLWAVEQAGQLDREKRLVRAVASYPALWQPGHPYIDGEETMWIGIAHDAGLPVGECKNMWGRLTKDLASHLQQAEPREKWKLEDEMEFCVPYIAQLSSGLKMPLKKEEALDISMEQRGEGHNDLDVEFLDDELDTSPLELCQVECPGSPAAARLSDNLQQPPEKTLIEFFTNMARTTAGFPPRLQAHVKAEVFSAVNRAEIELHSQLLNMDLQLQAGIAVQNQHRRRWRTTPKSEKT